MADTNGYYRNVRVQDSGAAIADTQQRNIARFPTVVMTLRVQRTTQVVLSRTIFVMRAWDSGGGGQWVMWKSQGEANFSPASSETYPNYSGALSNIRIAGTVAA